MNKEKENKWHEDIFLGILFAIMGLMFLFNGYSRLASGFLNNGSIEGGPTKQKGIIALLSLLENGWWTYLIVAVLLLVSFLAIRTGVKKYKERKL